MKSFDMDDVPRGRMDREIARERRERADTSNLKRNSR